MLTPLLPGSPEICPVSNMRLEGKEHDADAIMYVAGCF